MALDLDVTWIHGARDCRQSRDPLIQTHQADDTTYIFRQSKCANFEAPFMYLLIGATHSLLLDTGAAVPRGSLPIRSTVDRILARHTVGRRPLQLIVAHSHAHADHAAGDAQFARRPHTEIVTSLSEIQTRFGIDEWPDGIGSLDLGERVLTIIPIPGHEDRHIAIHDGNTRVMLTGDTFYPGLLVVNHWPAYRASARRLAAFARSQDVTWCLGAHVEMPRSGQVFVPPTTFQPDEHPLQMSSDDLFQWADACERLDEAATGRHTFASFVIDIR